MEERFVEPMGRLHDGSASFLLPAGQPTVQRRPLRRIDACEGFVEEQASGREDAGPCQRDTEGFAGGQLMGEMPKPVAEPEGFQGANGRFAALVGRGLDQAQGDLDLRHGVESGKEARIGADPSKPATFRWQRGDVGPVLVDGSSGRGLESGDQAEQGGLACAGGACDDAACLGWQGQRDIVHGLDAADVP